MILEDLNSTLKYKNNNFYFFKNSFVNSFYNISFNFSFLIGINIINYKNDIVLSSDFSFSFRIFSIIYLPLTLGFSDIIGIQVSKLIAKNKMNKVYLLLIKKKIIISIFIIIFLLFLQILKYFLFFIGIENNLIYNSYKIIYYSIPYLILSLINKIYEAFYISNEIKNYFLITISLSYLILLISMLMGMQFNFTFFLFPFGKLIQESFMLILNLYYLNKNFIKLDKYFKLAIKNDLFFKFNKDFKFCFKIIIGMTFQFFSFEINNIYLGLVNNKIDISVWSSFFNFIGILTWFVIGISNSIRTEVSYLIGSNKLNMAKSFCDSKLKIFSFIYFIIGLVIYIFSNLISNLYFHNNKIIYNLSILLKLYLLIISIDLILPLLSIILRIINKLKFYLISNLIIAPISMTILGYYLIIVKNLGSLGCFINFSISQILIYFILTIDYFSINFNKIKLIN